MRAREGRRHGSGRDGAAWRSLGRRDAAGGRRHGVELGEQLIGRLPPVGRPFLEAAHHEGGERRGDGGPQRRQRVRGQRDVRREHRLRARGDERRPPPQHLVGEHADRVQIGAVVGARVGGPLLGGHVGGRAQGDAERGERAAARGRAHGLGDAEVGYDRVLSREQHVVGLDIAMHHALGVGVRQRVHDVPEDAHRLPDRELALASELGAQRLAGDEWHDVVEQAEGGTRGEQLHDVGVLQRGGELDLAAEALGIDAGRELGGQHLDDDAAAQRHLFGQEHAAHTAAAELPLDPVGRSDGLLELLSQVGHRARSEDRGARGVGAKRRGEAGRAKLSWAAAA